MDMENAGSLGNGHDHFPDQVTSATAVVDARGNVTGWSASAQRLLGYRYEDVVGRPAARLLGSDADAMGVYSAVIEGRSGTTLLRHRDGHHMEAELQAYASLDREGNAQWLIMATPTQQSRPYQEPRSYKGEATTEEAFAQCHLPLMIYDTDLRALRGSAGAALELGLTEEQIRGRRVTDILPPHICSTVEEGMRRVFETGEPEEFQVHGRPRHGARERFWAVTASPLRNPAGQVRHVQLIAIDVTEQHRARERLVLLNDVSTQVGSTLDVTRTAQEMADVAVGRLADFISVDLLDSLFRGVEPRPSATGSVALRRAAQGSVLPGIPEAVIQPGEVDYYPESSPPPVAWPRGGPRCTAPWTKPSRAGRSPTPSARGRSATSGCTRSWSSRCAPAASRSAWPYSSATAAGTPSTRTICSSPRRSPHALPWPWTTPGASHASGPLPWPCSEACCRSGSPPRRPRRWPTATSRPVPGQDWAATGSM